MSTHLLEWTHRSIEALADRVFSPGVSHSHHDAPRPVRPHIRFQGLAPASCNLRTRCRPPVAHHPAFRACVMLYLSEPTVATCASR
jgi:hypothetical protein